jgi:biotin carboxylase
MPLRLMILGGGSSQIAAFHRARREGFFTILADHNPDAPARVLADAFAPASTFDVEAVTAAARDHRADALLAIGTDQPVLTAARVSATLNLPFPLSPEQARLLTNKAPMKRRFAAAGIPSAPWALLGADETRWDADGLAALTPPWVAKPVDSQGQRGIAVVHSREQLLAHRPHLLSHSREDLILVEEYYPSREVTVSGWVDEAGTPEIWTITDRVTFADENRIGVCVAHRYPSLHTRVGGNPAATSPGAPAVSGDCAAEVRDLTRRVVAAFELAGGPIYFQMLLGARGVLVNEIAFRLGGAYEDQSIPLVTGIDILGRQLDSIRAAAGKRANTPVSARNRRVETGSRSDPAPDPPSRCFAVPLMFCSPGTIAALEGDTQMRATPGVGACQFLLPEGTTIRPMADSTQRIAYAVLHGPDEATVNSLVDTLFDTLRVIGTDGRNMLLDTRSATKLLG